MASPVSDSYSCLAGGIISGGRWPELAVRTLNSDGVWTWYNDDRAVSYNGNTYFGSLDHLGNVVITKVNVSTFDTSSYTLHSTLQVDDHCVPVVSVLSDGKLFVAYAENQGSAVRYRISSNAEDITSWTTEATKSGPSSALAYANPRYLSGPDRLILLSRAVVDANTREHIMTVSTDGGSTWGANQYWLYTGANKKPYLISTVHGTDEIHCLFTDQHPAQGQTSLYHMYAKWHTGDGALRWYKTDGTLISTALPLSASDATLIYDGSSVRCWNWDISLDTNGYPRVLFTKYPNNDGSVIQMMYSRWDGSAWTSPVQVGDNDSYLYSAEPFYAGGACFYHADTDRVFISNKVGGIREIQEWDVSGTPVKLRDITTGTTSGTINARPISPKGTNGRLRGLFWSGTYTSYTSYSTAVKGF